MFPVDRFPGRRAAEPGFLFQVKRGGGEPGENLFPGGGSRGFFGLAEKLFRNTVGRSAADPPPARQDGFGAVGLHHQQRQKKFGTVFPLFDRVFGIGTETDQQHGLRATPRQEPPLEKGFRALFRAGIEEPPGGVNGADFAEYGQFSDLREEQPVRTASAGFGPKRRFRKVFFEPGQRGALEGVVLFRMEFSRNDDRFAAGRCSRFGAGKTERGGRGAEECEVRHLGQRDQFIPLRQGHRVERAVPKDRVGNDRKGFKLRPAAHVVAGRVAEKSAEKGASFAAPLFGKELFQKLGLVSVGRAAGVQECRQFPPDPGNTSEPPGVELVARYQESVERAAGFDERKDGGFFRNLFAQFAEILARRKDFGDGERHCGDSAQAGLFFVRNGLKLFQKTLVSLCLFRIGIDRKRLELFGYQGGVLAERFQFRIFRKEVLAQYACLFGQQRIGRRRQIPERKGAAPHLLEGQEPADADPFGDLKGLFRLVAVDGQKKRVVQLFGPEAGVGRVRGGRIGGPVVEIGVPQKLVVQVGGRAGRHFVEGEVQPVYLKKAERPFSRAGARLGEQLFPLAGVPLAAGGGRSQVAVMVGVTAFGQSRRFQRAGHAAQKLFGAGGIAEPDQPGGGQQMKRRGDPARPDVIRDPRLNEVERQFRFRIVPEDVDGGQFAQSLFDFKNVAERVRRDRAFKIRVRRLEDFAALQVDVSEGDERRRREEMVVFPFHQKRIAETVDGLFMFAGPFQAESEDHVQKRARPVVPRNGPFREAFDDRTAPVVGGGQRAEDFVSAADRQCRAAEDLNRVDLPQFRILQHPPLFDPLVGNRVADPNHRIVGEKPQGQIARAGAPGGGGPLAVARSGRVFDAGDPVGCVQVDVDGRLERFQRRGQIACDISRLAQNCVVADRIDPALLSDFCGSRQFVAAKLRRFGKMALLKKLHGFVMGCGGNRSAPLRVERRKEKEKDGDRPKRQSRAAAEGKLLG